jgi:peptide/nickel transport system permease protein
MLFFVVNSPDQMARVHLGEKNVTVELMEKWKRDHGYDKPLFFNKEEYGIRKVTDTLFFDKSIKLFKFDFGNADNGRNIGYDIRQRMWPSLAIAIPSLLVGLLMYITFAMILAFFRATYIDVWGVTLCVVLLSISYMFYVIGGQWLIGKLWNLLPISGYDIGTNMIKFLILPLVVSVIAGIGASTRLYRMIFLEEIGKDYIRTAKAKGLSEKLVLFKHTLRNAMIPILTQVVSVLPTLFFGALITESFFGIPGLGSYVIDGIQAQDFGIVRSMVFLGSVLYILGLLLTDISYTIADPRIRLS